jgi:ParB-like chromosome segregation protein Spo0J
MKRIFGPQPAPVEQQLLEALGQVRGKAKTELINRLREVLHEASDQKDPIDYVRWVPSSKVKANDYNPNRTARPEMALLVKSIEEDGVTQPIVTFYDSQEGTYIVVDGFHRYSVLTQEQKREFVPVVVIDKPIQDRMASTIRHNRARGKHQVDLMGELVKTLLKLGWEDRKIAEHLGMEAEEVLRLRQTARIATQLSAKHYSKSWEFDDEA